MTDSRDEIARVVSEAAGGTLAGPEELVQAFYPELKRLAAAKMKREPNDHSWQPTVLVNELYMELVKVRELQPVHRSDARERAAFLALASRVMHWLLVRHTRPLSWRSEQVELPLSLSTGEPGADRLAYIDQLLNQLGNIEPGLRRVVELRVFEGLTEPDIAARLGCSTRTVARNWRFAKSWLQRQLFPVSQPGAGGRNVAT